MFKDIQIIHPPQLGPNIFHGHLMLRIVIDRIMYGQDVDVTMNADRSVRITERRRRTSPSAVLRKPPESEDILLFLALRVGTVEVWDISAGTLEPNARFFERRVSRLLTHPGGLSRTKLCSSVSLLGANSELLQGTTNPSHSGEQEGPQTLLP